MEQDSRPDTSGEMNVRRTTMEDGRYLIYYTFGETRAQSERPEPESAEAQAVPVATEESNV
jgi:hypothetical protein